MTMHNWRQRKNGRVVRLLCLATLLGCTPLPGQAPPLEESPFDAITPKVLEPGSPAGSYALSGLDTVNLYNGSLNFTVPLLQVGGRGKAGYTISLPIGTKWDVESQYDASGYAYHFKTGWWGNAPHRYRPATLLARTSGSGASGLRCNEVDDPHPNYVYYEYVTRLTVRMADGTEIELRDVPDDDTYKKEGGQPLSPPEDEVVYCADPSHGANRGKVWVAVDGSATTFFADLGVRDHIGKNLDQGASIPVRGTLYWADGTMYHFNNDGVVDEIKDRNGNTTTFKDIEPFGKLWQNFEITDPLERKIEVTLANDWDGDPEIQGYEFYDQISFKGAEGQVRDIKIYYADYWKSNYCPPNVECPDKPGLWELFPYFGSVANNHQTVVTKIVLPNDKSYYFYYNKYAELSRVVLPTGGAYEYLWENGEDPSTPSEYAPVVCSVCDPPPEPSGPSLLAVYRRVKERYEFADGLGSGWTRKTVYDIDMYFKDMDGQEDQGFSDLDPLEGTSLSPYRCSQAWCSKVTATDSDPLQGTLAVSEHYYYGSPPVAIVPPDLPEPKAPYSAWLEGREFGTVWPQLSVEETTLWEQRDTPSCFFHPGVLNEPALDTRVIQVDRTLDDNRIARTTYSYPTNLITDPTANSNNVSDEYGYGIGSPGSLLRRRTHTDYMANDGTYIGTDINPYPHLRRLPTLKEICADISCTSVQAKTEYQYDGYGLTTRSATGYAGAAHYRGNLTTKTVWAGDGDIGLHTNIHYDVLGNALEIVDPKGNTTTISYTDSFTPGTTPPGQTYAFPTKVTNSMGWERKASYDYYLGAQTEYTDENGVKTTIAYENGSGQLDRVTGIVRAANDAAYKHKTSFTYTDTVDNLSVQTNQDKSQWDDGALLTKIKYDGFGRPTHSLLKESGLLYTYTRTKYDGLGRTNEVSNPYRTADIDDWDATTSEWTTTTYDALGRVTRITYPYPDSSETINTYYGNVTMLSDEAGHRRMSETDSLGRLTKVVEHPSRQTWEDAGITVEDPLNYQTSYTYDLMDNLLTVSQGQSQTRTFTYDTASRLLSADNPESDDPTSYTYDNNGNLLTKTDANGTKTCFGIFDGSQNCVQTQPGYDALNRPLRKSYSDGTPTVTYTYDDPSVPYSKGRLTAVANSVSTSQILAYDPQGRVAKSRQITDGISYSFAPNDAVGYIYNVDGSLASMTYPSGRVVSYGYDGAGRLAELDGVLGEDETDYVTAATYHPHGAINQLSLGNGLTETTGYNNRLQPTSITAANGSTLLSLGLVYGTSNNNNGNVLSQAIDRPGMDSLTQNYTYDELNRLHSFTEGAASRTNGYDQWGNRWVSQNTGLSLSPLTPTASTNFNTATNRLNGLSYDDAGNLEQVNPFTVIYDAENRVKSAASVNGSASYEYDGEGRRVIKRTCSPNAACTDQSPGLVKTLYVYDAMGQLAAEYSTQANPESGTRYLTADHLGSTRLETDEEGDMVRCYDYLPFGEGIPAGVNNRPACYSVGAYPAASDGQSIKFTGKERDAETGLDYFGARYLASTMGRFTSVDPLPGWQSDPQSWNMYAYGRNSPLKYVDPDGMNYVVCDANGDNCREFDDNTWLDYAKANNIKSTAGGSLYVVNDDGSSTVIGSASYYNEKALLPLKLAGLRADAHIKEAATQMALNAAIAAGVGALAYTTAVPGFASSSLLRQASRYVSKRTLKHLVNRGHIQAFQKLDPTLTVDDVIQLGIEVAETGTQVSGAAFVKTVQIAGKEVTVRVVLNINNALRSVHILE